MTTRAPNLHKLLNLATRLPCLDLLIAHDSTVHLTSGNVDTLTSLKGRTLVQGTGANRPPFTSNGLLGFGKIAFGGTHLLAGMSGFLNSKSAVSIVALVKGLAATGLTVPWEYSSSYSLNAGSLACITGVVSDGVDNRCNGANAVAETWESTAPAPGSGYRVVTQKIALGSGSSACSKPLRMDEAAMTGSYVSPGAASSPFGSYDFNLGARAGATFGATFDFAAMFFSDGVLTDADHFVVEQALSEIADHL